MFNNRPKAMLKCALLCVHEREKMFPALGPVHRCDVRVVDDADLDSISVAAVYMYTNARELRCCYHLFVELLKRVARLQIPLVVITPSARAFVNA